MIKFKVDVLYETREEIIIDGYSEEHIHDTMKKELKKIKDGGRIPISPISPFTMNFYEVDIDTQISYDVTECPSSQI